MGLVLLCVIWLITLASTYFFVAKTWWLPHGASAAAAAIDHQFAITFVIMGSGIFVAAQMALGYLVFKYRDGANPGRAGYSHGNTRPEISGRLSHPSSYPDFVGLIPARQPHLGGRAFSSRGHDATRVEVTGMQFAWYFRYPGPDGKFGSTKPELKTHPPAAKPPSASIRNDPASKDDVVTGIMDVPVIAKSTCILRAHDVIHSFFVPHMRFKQDAVPGLAIHMHFTPTEIGSYEIACAELCGLGHYKMHGILQVVSQADFDKWLKARGRQTIGSDETQNSWRIQQEMVAQRIARPRRPTRLYPQICFQPGPQGHRHSVLLPGAVAPCLSACSSRCSCAST